MVDAPVPMIATLRPVRSCVCFHCAEWNAVPAKVAMPGRSGMCGSDSAPPPLTKKSAVNEPRVVVMCHTLRVASHDAASSVVPKATLSVTP
jgi:hypothetical protein